MPPKPVPPMRQGTTWIRLLVPVLCQGTTWFGFLALVAVLYFWFARAASIPGWKHLVFGAVLGGVVVLLAWDWRRSIREAAIKEAEKAEAEKAEGSRD